MQYNYEIVFDLNNSNKTVQFVTKGSLTFKEFPLAAWRMLMTREFILYVFIPVVIILIGKMLQLLIKSSGNLGLYFKLFGVLWLLFGLVVILQFGKAVAISCYANEIHSQTKKLVAGLRMKVNKRNKIIRIAGVLVDPQHRKKGIFIALLFSLFSMAKQITEERTLPNNSNIKIAVFAPAHPASKNIVDNYFHGQQEISVNTKQGSPFMKSFDYLNDQIDKLEKRGLKYTFKIDSSAFSQFVV